MLALDWGSLDNALAAVAKEHIKFTEDALKKGFYTPDGLWVDLSGAVASEASGALARSPGKSPDNGGQGKGNPTG